MLHSSGGPMGHSSRAPRSRHIAISATLAVVAALLLFAGRVGAQAPTDATRAVRRAIVARTERRSLAAVRASNAPVIDGRLDDAAWSAASVGRDFVQRAPDVLQPATQ